MSANLDNLTPGKILLEDSMNRHTPILPPLRRLLETSYGFF